MSIEWKWVQDFAREQVERESPDYLLVEGRAQKLTDAMFKAIRSGDLPVVVASWQGDLVERPWEDDASDATRFSVGVDFRVNPSTALGWMNRKTKPTVQSEARRRLELLRQLGGECLKDGSRWKVNGFNRLVAEERLHARARSSPKTIRADLVKAATEERDRKREGGPPASRFPT